MIFKTTAYLRAFGNGKQGSAHRWRYCLQWQDEFGRNMMIERAEPLRNLIKELSLPRYKGLAKNEGIVCVKDGRNVYIEEVEQVAKTLGVRFAKVEKRILRNRKG